MKAKRYVYHVMVVFVLIALSAGILTLHVIGYTTSPPSPIVQKDIIDISRLSSRERLKNPRAILVLDVSGSMGVTRNPSDPGRYQTTAVIHFYDLFSQLAREVVEPGERATIAVVLFATVAQVIDWTGKEEAFLEVKASNRDLFKEVILRHLGTPPPKGEKVKTEEDPRRGKDTDCAAALDAVTKLVKDQKSPPAVVFMTDGECSPNGFFSPHLTDLQKTELKNYNNKAMEKETAKFPPSRLHYLSARDKQQKIYRRPDSLQTEIPRDKIDLEPGIKIKVSHLLKERYQVSEPRPEEQPRTAPMVWVPVFLKKKTDKEQPSVQVASKDEVVIRRTLAHDDTSKEAWGLADELVRCREPERLVGKYVTVLARWFRLIPLPIEPGRETFRIPAHTQAFAVQVETSGSAKVDLRRQGKRHPLSGRDKHWGGVISGTTAGQWQVAARDGAVQQVTAYYRPRYDWAIAVPRSYGFRMGGKAPSVHLHVCRLGASRCDTHKQVFTGLPQELRGSVALPDSGETIPFSFKLAGPSRLRPPPVYEASLPVQQTHVGRVTVTVDLEPLKTRANIPMQRSKLRRTLVLRPMIQMSVTDDEGRPTSIGIDRVPRVPAWIQRAWKRFHD